VTLTAREIAEITRLLEDSSFDELHLEIDGLKLHLRRRSTAPPQMVDDSAVAGVPAHITPIVPDDAQPAEEPIVRQGDLQEVSAPMLGTFYRAPKPGEPPFVEVGAPVEADTIIGIIEVMKLMNTVRAGVRGIVVEIPGRDGALVEYGETLLRVRRTSEP